MHASTYTYVILDISSPAFNEIKQKLEDAGYQHTFNDHDGRLVIDMHGIAIAEDSTTSEPETKRTFGNRFRWAVNTWKKFFGHTPIGRVCVVSESRR